MYEVFYVLPRTSFAKIWQKFQTVLKGRRKNVTIFKVSKVDRSALKSAPRQLIKSIFRRFQTAVRSLRSLTPCLHITYDDVTRHGTLTSVGVRIMLISKREEVERVGAVERLQRSKTLLMMMTSSWCQKQQAV